MLYSVNGALVPKSVVWRTIFWETQWGQLDDPVGLVVAHAPRTSGLGIAFCISLPGNYSALNHLGVSSAGLMARWVSR